MALLLPLLLDQGTGTQQLVARMGEADAWNSGRMGGLALMIAITAIIAAALGSMMAAILMPDARLLFLAIALLIGGCGLLIAPFRKRPMMDQEARPMRLRTLLTFALRRAGENGAFATAGVAAFTDAPVLTAIGATLGGWAAVAPAVALSRRYTHHGLLRLFQFLAGSILLCIAIGCAANALRIA